MNHGNVSLRTSQNIKKKLDISSKVPITMWYIRRRHLLVQINKGNTRAICEIYSKVTIKTQS